MNVSINSSSTNTSNNSGNTGNILVTEVLFTGQTVVDVTHNRAIKPIVDVCNNAGQQIFAQVTYLNLNTFRIDFNTPQSGSIRYI